MTDNIYTMDDLAKEFKDDPDFKNEPGMATIGIKAEEIAIAHDRLMDMKVKPREAVLRPILTKGGILLLHAVAGAGKSHFSLNCAYAVALGGHFLKYEAPLPKKVLYIDGELGHEDIHRYVRPIEKMQGELFFKENLTYLCKDRFPNGIIPKLSDELGRKWYTDYILRSGFEVVFWDNLRMLSNIDENRTADWAPIEELFLFFRDKGVSTWLIHHAGADGTKQRGVSARMDAVNTVISLQKLNEDENDGKIKVIYQKGRHLSQDESLPFEAHNHFDGSWSFKNIEVSFDEQVLDLLRRKLPVVAIAKELGTYARKVYRAVDRLKVNRMWE